MNIILDKVTKSYRGHTVLNHINLNIQDKRSLVLIGPSGGGKTTLLRILGGLEPPTTGKVIVNGQEVCFEPSALKNYRKKIGVVFQAYNLFPHLNALENIMLPLEKVHGLLTSEAKEQALALLERFDLQEHIQKKPSELSGGQQQRVAICRAVSIKPDFLLLDEPTSALDPEYTSEVLDLIEELLDEQMNLILVTHEMGFARHTAEHLVFLDQGKAISEGTSEDIFGTASHPKVQRFLKKVLKHG